MDLTTKEKFLYGTVIVAVILVLILATATDFNNVREKKTKNSCDECFKTISFPVELNTSSFKHACNGNEYYIFNNEKSIRIVFRENCSIEKLQKFILEEKDE